MKPQLHIIVTCLNPELRDAALLVFKTVRVGFPTADIFVYSNALSGSTYGPLSQICQSIGAKLGHIGSLISHDHFVESLLYKQHQSYWICDTDVVFYDKVEDFKCPLFGGRFEPQFRDEWTDSTHVACLHPSLMYFNPAELRCAIVDWRTRHIPKFFPNAISNLIRQQFTVRDGATIFHDTASGLHHAFGGSRFSDEMNAKFEHLHCSCVVDAISKEVESLKDLEHIHRAVCHNPELARGLFEKQLEYYKSCEVK